jgi:hypothetical protein
MLVLLSGVSFAQSLTKEEKALEEWLPSSIGEYELDGLPLTVTSKAADKPYSMSSKVYKKGASTLTIVIFDYKKDPDLLKKYTSSWSASPVDDETQTASLVTVEELPSWESFSKKENASQLYVNVKDRYLLYLTGKGNTTSFLKTVVKELKPRQLPQ